MSRWAKNIVVPLDSLCKEKENTNRPTVARSVGTVGKWGKMGFTSTRTYALAALPTPIHASPGESPSSGFDFDMSPSVPEPPKPKKFFKSVNAAPPEVIAQMIQHLPRAAPTSPIREHCSKLSSPISPQETTATSKAKVLKKKQKTPAKVSKATTKASANLKSSDEQMSDTSEATSTNTEVKPAKKVKEKILKPEAPPSRVLGRTRKCVNYCEDYEDIRAPLSSRDTTVGKAKETKSRQNSAEISPTTTTQLPPVATSIMNAPKAPEHRPIVLRISKVSFKINKK